MQNFFYNTKTYNTMHLNDFKFFSQKKRVECSSQFVQLLALSCFSSFQNLLNQADEIAILRHNKGEIPTNITSNSLATKFVITGGHELTHIDFIYEAKEKPTSLVITGAHSLRHLSPSPHCKNPNYDRLSDLYEIVLTGAHLLEDIPLKQLKNLRELTITGGDRFRQLKKIKKIDNQFHYINIRYAANADDYVKNSPRLIAHL